MLHRCVRNEARALRVDVVVAEAALHVREESLRDYQMKLLLCAHHSDVEQPALFKVRGYAVIHDVENTDDHFGPLAEWIVERIR
jgi:hypothetical protein